MRRQIFVSVTAFLSLHAFVQATDISRGQVKVAAAALELQATDDMVIAGGIGPGHAKGQDALLRAVATVIQGPPHDTRVAIVALDILVADVATTICTRRVGAGRG